MMIPLNTTDERYLVSLVQDRTGLVLNKHQVEELQHLVVEAMATHHLGELKEFLQVFPFTHPLWQGFIQRLTIGETYFFRNAAHFNALRHEILMPLIAERRKSGFRQLRLWSAGCATGEEPYSLAMLLRELIHDIEDWAITLLATDINAGFLDAAREGLYGQRAFRGETPSWIQPRWFRLESGKYRLNQDVRQMVMFRPLNLVTDAYPSAESFTANMDVILCRNVTIYFNEATTRHVTDRFYRALNDKGWLVVGHSEPNSAIYGAFSSRNLRNTVVYQKVAQPPNGQKPLASPPLAKPVTRAPHHASPCTPGRQSVAQKFAAMLY
ncbi:protein-glutamate O-methyltransferase CheR [bacterium]|nr:protein-glutamate O-methyltransferase CheR [bacterium]